MLLGVIWRGNAALYTKQMGVCHGFEYLRVDRLLLNHLLETCTHRLNDFIVCFGVCARLQGGGYVFSWLNGFQPCFCSALNCHKQFLCFLKITLIGVDFMIVSYSQK